MQSAPISAQTLLLSSKQGTTFPPNPKPPKFFSKYLARTLHFNHQDDPIKLKIISIKRFHIRSFIISDPRSPYQREAVEQFPAKTRVILKKKLFKGLTSLQISYFFQRYWLQELKHFKSLVQFTCAPNSDCKIQSVVLYLKKLNKNIEKVSLVDHCWMEDPEELEKVHRALGRLHNLQSYGGYTVFHGLEANQTYVGFTGLNKCLTELPRLRSFECNISSHRLLALRHLMNGDSVYEKVTKLCIDFEYLKTEEEVEDEYENEEEDDDENEYEEEGDDDEFEERDDQEESEEEEENDEVFPFFQFQTFPNLTELHIQDQPRYCSYGRFVVEGFKNLSSLKKLSLELTSCSGVHFIFEGLSHLPQLSSFSLDYANEIESHVWEYLTHFLQQQANLVSLWISLYLDVKSLRSFEDFLASLSHKPKLQYLTLRTNILPFHILSNSFKQIIGSDQLKSLQIKAISGLFTFSQGFSQSFEGFYDFLLRNKNTLFELELDFPLFKHKPLNDTFAKVLSQLTHLKTLSLDISVESLLLWRSEQLYHCDKAEDEEDNQDSWNLSLNDILPQLEKIQDLTLSFTGLEKCPSEYRKFMINCFRVLPSLKNLRRLAFSLPKTGLSSTEFGSINVVLGELKSLLSIELLNTDIEDDNLKQIEAKVMELQQYQSLQISLSF